MILSLPCGCVADFLQIVVTEQDVALCPWCDSSFDAQELHAWLLALPEPPVVQRRKISVKVGTCAYEVVGRLPCGCPEVRERGGEPFHLDADENKIELLAD
jgi:hypothetical protein